jgi:hypothetical protein
MEEILGLLKNMLRNKERVRRAGFGNKFFFLFHSSYSIGKRDGSLGREELPLIFDVYHNIKDAVQAVKDFSNRDLILGNFVEMKSGREPTNTRTFYQTSEGFTVMVVGQKVNDQRVVVSTYQVIRTNSDQAFEMLGKYKTIES